MKIFLTGMTGFLGCALAAHFRAAEYQIAGSSRRTAAMPGVELVYAALGDPIQPSMFADSDVVVHAAHDFAPGSMARNIEGTLAMRDAAAAAGVGQQIFLTSYSARPDAESEYGRTKYQLEQLFSDSGSAVLRLGLVIGNGGLFARQRALLLRTPIVPLLGGGTDPVAVVALSHVLASVEAVVRKRRSGSWNLFYDARPPMKEFVRQIKMHAGQRSIFLPVGARLAAAAVEVARSMGLPIPIEPGQIRALQLNRDSSWKSDLPELLPGREAEFQLTYALEQLAPCSC